MRLIIILFILALVDTNFTVAAYANKTMTVTAKNISIEGKVPRINLPIEGVKFLVVWIREDNSQWEKIHFARKGNNAYEMRDHPKWNGIAKSVLISNFAGTATELKENELINPSFKDELNMFLAPEQLVSSTANSLYGHTIFGWKWNKVLIFLMVIFLMTLHYYQKIKFTVSLFIAFVVVWGIMDLRTMYDHYSNVKGIENNISLKQIKYLKSEIETASDKLDGKTWTRKKMGWPYDIVTDYELSEYKYLPYTPDSEVDFVVSMKNGNLVFSEREKK